MAGLASRNSQIVFLCEFGETDTTVPLSTDDIAKIFDIHPENVRQIRHRARMKQRNAHRPLTLDLEQESDVIGFIHEQFASQHYVTQRELLNYVEEKFAKILTSGWMQRFLDRHKSDVSRAIVNPQEQVRMEVPRASLDEYLLLIKKLVQIVPTELIFNLDETGLSDWENRKSKPVIVPAAAGDSRFHYPINRSIRHHTLLCCITAAGDSYCPLLIAPNAGARKLFDTGVRDHVDLMIEIRQPAYATADLFRRYIEEIFFPALAANREMPGCRDKLAILFCDNCSIHCSEILLREFAEKGVVVVTYPPHTSHIFQVLDVLLFGRLKSAKKYIPRNDADASGIDHLVRIFKAYEMVTTSTTIRASWVKAGFEYCRRDDAFYLLVNDGKIRDSPDFSEIWRMNFPVEALSTRRRNQKWGLMNQPYFKARYLKILNRQGLN
jgi:hypothetical protein